MAKFVKAKNLSPWRRLSLATWKKPDDATVYGQFDFDATRLIQFVEEFNSTAPVKITQTIAIAKILGHVIAQYPEINGIIRWGNIYYRDSVDLFLQVAIKKTDYQGDQLSGTKIANIDKKSLHDIASELGENAQKIRSSNDPQFQKQFNLARSVPQFLLRPLIRLNELLVHDFGFHLPKLGLVADPFGSAMFTSAGSLNVPPGLAPLVPPSRCPFIFCAGRIEKKPWVIENDVIAARPVMGFSVTFDHRFMDGLTGAKMFNTLMDLLYHPEKVGVT